MNKMMFGLGFLTSAIGTTPFLVLVGVLPAGTPSPDSQPEWLAFAIGLVFICGGISVMIKGFVTGNADGDLPATAPPAMRAIYHGLGIAIAGLLAALFSWVAFGPGARHFSMSAGGFTAPAGAGGDVVGRVLFGAVALMGWFMVGVMVLNAARRRRYSGDPE